MGKLVIKPRGVVHISYNGNGSGGGDSNLGDPAALVFDFNGNEFPFSYVAFEHSKFLPDYVMYGFPGGGPQGYNTLSGGTYYPGNYDEDWNDSVTPPAVPSGSIIGIKPLVPEDTSGFEWGEFEVIVPDPDEWASGGGEGGGGGNPK